MRTLDRIFGWLLVCASVAQLAVFFLRPDRAAASTSEGIFGLTLAGLFLSAMNLMRAERPHDRTLARICVAANVSLLALLILLATTTHHTLGPLLEAAVVLALLPLSMRTRRRSRPM